MSHIKIIKLQKKGGKSLEIKNKVNKLWNLLNKAAKMIIIIINN